MACTLTVKRGHNVWLLARTNRDAPTPDEVTETTAAFLVKTLGKASPANTRGVFETVQSPAGNRRYYIGAARPVEIEAYKEPFTEALPGETYARRENCPEPVISSVEGKDSWWVVVEFDWRANDVEIPWPRRRVEWLGLTHSDDEPERPFDWLLLQASHLPAHVYDDSSLMEDVLTESSDRFKKEARALAKTIGAAGSTVLLWAAGGLLLMGIAYAVAKGSKQR